MFFQTWINFERKFGNIDSIYYALDRKQSLLIKYPDVFYHNFNLPFVQNNKIETIEKRAKNDDSEGEETQVLKKIKSNNLEAQEIHKSSITSAKVDISDFKTIEKYFFVLTGTCSCNAGNMIYSSELKSNVTPEKLREAFSTVSLLIKKWISSEGLLIWFFNPIRILVLSKVTLNS